MHDPATPSLSGGPAIHCIRTCTRVVRWPTAYVRRPTSSQSLGARPDASNTSKTAMTGHIFATWSNRSWPDSNSHRTHRDRWAGPDQVLPTYMQTTHSGILVTSSVPSEYPPPLALSIGHSGAETRKQDIHIHNAGTSNATQSLEDTALCCGARGVHLPHWVQTKDSSTGARANPPDLSGSKPSSLRG